MFSASKLTHTSFQNIVREREFFKHQSQKRKSIFSTSIKEEIIPRTFHLRLRLL